MVNIKLTVKFYLLELDHIRNMEKIYSPSRVINFLETGSSSVLQQKHDYKYRPKCSFLFSRDRVNHFRKQHRASLIFLRKINEHFIDVVIFIRELCVDRRQYSQV